MILTMLAAAAVALLLAILAVTCWRTVRRRRPWLGRALTVALILPAVPTAMMAAYLLARLLIGQPGPVERQLAEGIVYRRHVLVTPNRAVVHVVEFDRASQWQFAVTPPVATPAGLRNRAGYATDALALLNADVVVNASFFTPFHDNHVLDAYPGPGDWVESIGIAVSDGVHYGKAKSDWPSLWQTADGKMGLGPVPADVRQAVTGRQFLLRDGAIVLGRDEPPYPRTAVALNPSTDRCWFVVVDGKQPRYSDGLSLRDLARFLGELGATEAIELDGGGSSVLAVQGNVGPEVLSRPCHTKIPGRQRPTGVFLGLRRLDPVRLR
ncbi:MAG TPA: phosphodiester glycosidase family protein [Tepidisphaeraceae bacterium]|jgi:hypothetical protein